MQLDDREIFLYFQVLEPKKFWAIIRFCSINLFITNWSVMWRAWNTILLLAVCVKATIALHPGQPSTVIEMSSIDCVFHVLNK